MILDAKDKNIRFVEVSIETIYLENNQSTHFQPIRDSVKIYKVFLKFVISSLMAAVVDIGTFSLLIRVISNAISSKIYVATYVARVVSAVFNYMVNKKKVFNDKSQTGSSFIKYALLCVVIATASAFLTELLTNQVGIHITISKIIVDSGLFLISFSAQKVWIFKNRVALR